MKVKDLRPSVSDSGRMILKGFQVKRQEGKRA